LSSLKAQFLTGNTTQELAVKSPKTGKSYTFKVTWGIGKVRRD
jgi:hypothetical protein